MYATLFATAIPRGPFRFQVTPVGTAHEVMDPLMIVHSVTDALFATKARTTTVATCTAAPLDSPKAVTDAESGPRLGCVAKLIVSDVVDAAEIEPTVPLLRETVLPAAEGSNFCPLMTSVVWVELVVAELGVTTGGSRTTATTTVPLDSPKAVTDAESGPRLGCVAKLIVSYVVDAAEIESTVPLLRETVLPAAEGSKFCPLMTSVVEATSRLTELGVTIGAGGGPGGVGEGPGGPGGLGLLGTKTSPREEVSGIPVIGSTGSTVSGAAVTASLLF